MSERKRSFGTIDVGDTQGSALGTSPAGELRSRVRQKSLSENKPQTPAAPTKASVRRVQPSTIVRVEEFLWKYSWFLPLVFALSIFFGWCFVGGEWLDACVLLSYDRGNGLYGKGKKDIAFVLYYAVCFSFIREFCMQAILKPLATRLLKGAAKNKINRFLEQTYSMLYYGTVGPLGFYLMSQSDLWYFNTTAMYETYPHHADQFGFKLFYLLQAAFWTQQAGVLVLNLEKKRKDFKELVFHHIITLALIILSYRFHFTHIGLCIYITMDVSDFFLATSKTLNYLDHILTVPLFITFVGMWIYLRHWINLKILWSIITEFRTVGPFELNWETQQYKCWISQYITFALLFALQLVNIYWLFLIIRILVRYITHNEKEDVRSDYEDSE